MAGVMSTASGLVFAGDNEGNFMAFDAATGKNLWFYPTGAPIWGAAAMTFMLDGRQRGDRIRHECDGVCASDRLILRAGRAAA